jgi:hypothetical protein
MVYIIHGSDTQSSYLRLQELTTSLKDYRKVLISKENLDMLHQTLFSQDLFDTNKMVIVENLISDKKIEAKNLKSLSQKSMVIFWEDQEIPASRLRGFLNIAKIENFKLPQTLFYFLDSISPSYKKTLFYLSKLAKDQKGLSWHLENRLLQLLLAKLNLSQAEASQIMGKNIAPWQWQKITSQAKIFEFDKLKTLFSAVLKIETLVKTGVSSFSEPTLITLMLVKYLN